MRTRAIRYIRNSLALLAASAFFFSSFVTPDAKAGAGEGPKGEKTAGTTAAPAALFTNPAQIAINDDGVGTPYPSDINVTGLFGQVTSVKITLNGFAHSFPDDVGMVLKGPTGAALLIQDGAGSGGGVNVTYTIADSGVTQLPNQTGWTAGTYKPASYYTGDSFPAPGPLTAYGNPGPTGGGTATFASTFNGTAPNGTWSLFVVDFAAGGTGLISGGWTLEVIAITGDPFQTEMDFNGDGKADWVVTRNTGGGSNGQATWYIQENGGAENITYQTWGRWVDDFPMPADYDGDNRADIAVFRRSEGAWYILQSGTGTVRAELFGQQFDDPSIVGDYDGDGKADLAVTRKAGGLRYWFYRTTPNGPAFARQWGLENDRPAPGDYDGDGKFDFVVQHGDTFFSPAVYWMNYNSAAPGVVSRLVYFGRVSDYTVTGDYDGDGKTDIAVVRGDNEEWNWYIQPSSAPGTFFGGKWGAPGADALTPGDYDGDGKTDIAVWRQSGNPSQCFFLVRKSSDGALLSHEWGEQVDYPPASYNQH